MKIHHCYPVTKGSPWISVPSSRSGKQEVGGCSNKSDKYKYYQLHVGVVSNRHYANMAVAN